MTRRGVSWAVAVIAGVLALGGAAVLLATTDPASTPTKTTFDIMGEPQNAADRAAIASFRGESEVDFSNGRLLGVGPGGEKYLIAARGQEVCLIVIDSSESAGGACDLDTKVAREGIVLKSGRNGVATVAILIPDEYTDAKVETAEGIILRDQNILVLDSRPDHSDLVRFDSSRWRDLTLRTPR